MIIKVNFGNENSALPSDEFILDFGRGYSETQGYGWITQASLDSATTTPIDISTNTRDRDLINEQSTDTLIHLQYPSNLPGTRAARSIETPSAWEYDLDNGTYQITVSVGDPEFIDSNHVINIEGESVIAGFTPTEGELFTEVTTTVEVTDGRLTLDAIGGENTKLNFVEIVPEESIDSEDSDSDENTAPENTIPDTTGTDEEGDSVTDSSSDDDDGDSERDTDNAAEGSTPDATGTDSGSGTPTDSADTGGDSEGEGEGDSVADSSNDDTDGDGEGDTDNTAEGSTPDATGTDSGSGTPTDSADSDADDGDSEGEGEEDSVADSSNDDTDGDGEGDTDNNAEGLTPDATGTDNGSGTPTDSADSDADDGEGDTDGDSEGEGDTDGDSEGEGDSVTDSSNDDTDGDSEGDTDNTAEGSTPDETGTDSGSGTPTDSADTDDAEGDTDGDSEGEGDTPVDPEGTGSDTLEDADNSDGINDSDTSEDVGGEVAIPVEGGGVVERIEPISAGINFNFGIPRADSPSGFNQDIGEAYDAERGYGWVTQDSAGSASLTPIDLVVNGRDRDTLFNDGFDQFAEPVRDSLIHMQYPTGLPNSSRSVTTPAAWEYEIANGQYEVTVGVGDPEFFDSNHVINVEGENLISGFVPAGFEVNGNLPLGAQAFSEGTATVEVTDGSLTLDSIGGENTKVNFISIVPVDAL